VRSRTKSRAIATKTLALAAASLCVLPACAQASPEAVPFWKLLAVTGPTHLAPKQSEIQRVAVEAEGGTFTLARRIGEGKGTPVTQTGFLALEKGNLVATAISGTFEAGERVTAAGYIPSETTVVSVTGNQVTLSKAPEAPSSGTANKVVKIFTKQMSSVTGGPYHVGDELTGTGLAPGTKVTAIGAGTLTLSKVTGAAYETGQLSFTVLEPTAALPFDASAEEVQSALDALPAFLPGDFKVIGGPGGAADHPYFVDFGEELAEEDIEPFIANSTELVGEHAFAHVFTTLPGGNGTGEIVVFPTDMGGKDSSGTIAVHVGPLPAGILTSATAEGNGWSCSGGAGESSVSCFTETVFKATRSSSAFVSVPIEIQSTDPFSAGVPVEISGGGAPPATYQLPIVVSGEPAPFGLAATWSGSFEADGSPSTQAGAHPFSAGAEFVVNTVRSGGGRIVPAGGDAHEEVFDLPPGFVGNPLATKRCPQSSVVEAEEGSDLCNEEMSVGILSPFITSLNAGVDLNSRLFNDHPPRGFAAEFSAYVGVPFQSVLATVNAEEDFGIRLRAPNNPNYNKIYGAFTAFEGVPKLGNGQALLTNPVSCAESAASAPTVRASADTWNERGHFSEPTVLSQPALEGCDQLRFEAEDPETGDGQVGFSFQPTSTQGSSPVEATAHLHIDVGGLTEDEELATPELKRSVIQLPAGLSLNPSQANGLEACTETQIGFKGSGYPMPAPMRFTEAQPQCPDASKLGTAKIDTPLLDNPLAGEVFLAAQEENPFGSLLAVYLVVNDPFTGVIVKLPGEVQLDPGTGRMTAIFDNNPQLPFEDLYLHFRGGGPRSEFATSEVCGTSGAEGEWTPWSAPESGPPAQTTDSFEISGNCSASASSRPFSPSFEAGTTDPKAGSYSPLVVKIARNDGEQELSRFDFTMPPGFSGKLAGIPYCTEDQIHAAEAKTGTEEQQSPSCPAASKLGTIDAAAGVGSEPIHVGGSLYLAGPYRGAPLSAVAITPALAGPYDLGDVVVRTPLELDPVTAQLTAKSDPLPRILRGIPLKIRSVAISVDRDAFTLNPTSCEAMSVSASLSGSSGASANPTNRFQVGGCGELGFAPKFNGKLKGGTKRGDHPAFTATLTYPQGAYANLSKISVALPHSEFLENAHIGTVCTRVQFAADQCPAASIYGKVVAVTPLLDRPLTGYAYLRSSSNKLPDLVIALHGPPSQPIEIDLDGRIDSIKGGIRTSFEAVPDAPVSKVVVQMFGGKKGLLVNSRNLCRSGGGRMTIKMAAHNNRRSNVTPALRNECKRSKHKKSHSKHHRSHKRGSARLGALSRAW